MPLDIANTYRHISVHPIAGSMGAEIRGADPLPCVIYLHGNSGSRCDATEAGGGSSFPFHSVPFHSI